MMYLKTNEYSVLEKHFKNQDLISIDDLIGLIEELESDKEYLEEELDDLMEDLHENYKPIPASELYNVSDNDFI